MQPSVLQQRHLTSATASQDQSHSTTDSSSERTCQFSRLFYPSIQYFNDDTFEKRCYFNDNNTEGYYCNDDNFEKLLLYQARGDLEAGQEGHHELLGKAGGPREYHYVVPPPEPTKVPPLPTLPLAGLV